MRGQVKASWQIPKYYILMGASESFLANPKVLHSNEVQVKAWQIPQKLYCSKTKKVKA